MGQLSERGGMAGRNALLKLRFSNLHGGEFLFEKCLRRGPLHRQLLALLLTFITADCQTKVSNLGPQELVQQNIPGKGN